MEKVTSFTPITTPGPPGTVRIHIVFNHPPLPWDHQPEPTGYGIEFTYRLTDAGAIDPQPVAVALHTPGGLTASELARFAWTRWEHIAVAAARLRHEFSLDTRDHYRDTIEATQVRLGLRHARRPGRKGHPDDFYQRIAADYQRLLIEHPHNPTAALADEHNVARSTAAGWVQKARKRKILPPAHKGRPG